MAAPLFFPLPPMSTTSPPSSPLFSSSLVCLLHYPCWPSSIITRKATVCHPHHRKWPKSPPSLLPLFQPTTKAILLLPLPSSHGCPPPTNDYPLLPSMPPACFLSSSSKPTLSAVPSSPSKSAQATPWVSLPYCMPQPLLSPSPLPTPQRRLSSAARPPSRRPPTSRPHLLQSWCHPTCPMAMLTHADLPWLLSALCSSSPPQAVVLFPWLNAKLLLHHQATATNHHHFPMLPSTHLLD